MQKGARHAHYTQQTSSIFLAGPKCLFKNGKVKQKLLGVTALRQRVTANVAAAGALLTSSTINAPYHGIIQFQDQLGNSKLQLSVFTAGVCQPMGCRPHDSALSLHTVSGVKSNRRLKRNTSAAMSQMLVLRGRFSAACYSLCGASSCLCCAAAVSIH